MSPSRLNILADFYGFNKGSTPFNYLGVPLFKGKPKKVFLQPIADKVINKLASWKGSLLSFAGRVVLVNSTIQGMLTHSMTFYTWLMSLIRDLERALKRLIWSGETSKNKVVIVAWNNICKPLEEGRLGIRSLIKLNEASNLKLAWGLLNSSESWFILLRKIVTRNNKVSPCFLFHFSLVLSKR